MHATGHARMDIPDLQGNCVYRHRLAMVTAQLAVLSVSIAYLNTAYRLAATNDRTPCLGYSLSTVL
jgi:hypothetical protein